MKHSLRRILTRSFHFIGYYIQYLIFGNKSPSIPTLWGFNGHSWGKIWKAVNDILTNIDQLKEIAIGAMSSCYTVNGACSYSGFNPTKIRKAIRTERLKAFREDGEIKGIFKMICSDKELEFNFTVRKPWRKESLRNAIFSLIRYAGNGNSVRIPLTVVRRNSLHFNA